MVRYTPTWAETRSAPAGTESKVFSLGGEYGEGRYGETINNGKGINLMTVPRRNTPGHEYEWAKIHFVNLRDRNWL